MSGPKEFDKSFNLTYGALFFGVAFIISTTFSATTIYHQFGQTQAEMEVLKSEIDYTNERLDRKVGRVEDEVKILTAHVEELRQD